MHDSSSNGLLLSPIKLEAFSDQQASESDSSLPSDQQVSEEDIMISEVSGMSRRHPISNHRITKIPKSSRILQTRGWLPRPAQRASDSHSSIIFRVAQLGWRRLTSINPHLHLHIIANIIHVRINSRSNRLMAKTSEIKKLNGPDAWVGWHLN